MHQLSEKHIFQRFDGELSHLHDLVLEMGGIVHQQLKDALEAFKTQNLAMAQQVMSRDPQVDSLEVQADAAIINVIARHSPLGSDLRTVITVSKSVSDLEKIGDEAARIAHLQTQISREDHGTLNRVLVAEIDRIGEMALSNYLSAVELFEAWDETKALRVIEGHRQMDGEFQSELQRLMSSIKANTIDIGLAVSLALVAKALERITHHAQNLAEYAMFEREGVDLRLNQH